MTKGRLLLGLGLAAAVAAPTLGNPLHVRAATGNVTVNKVVVACNACNGLAETGQFNLQIDGATAGTGANVGNGGTTGALPLTSSPAPGTPHTIGETAGNNTSMANYSAVYTCSDAGMSISGDATVPFTVNVVDGANITCTITNTHNAAGGPRAQEVLGSGSDTTQFMMHSIDGLYLFSPGCQQIALPGATKFYDFSCLAPDPTGTVPTENYQHDQVHEASFLGSGNGIHQICNQGLAGNAHIDYARSSRASSTSDCKGLHFVAYARDGISWEAFDDGTTASGIHGMNNQADTCAGSGGLTQFCLSQAQLQGIFITCTITNWSQVGGQNVPISIYTPQAGSGTRLTWDTFLGGPGNSQNCIPAAQQATHIIDENENVSIPASDRAGAIFPFSAGIWKTQVNSKGGAVLGAVDNVYPSTSTISSSVFPYGRFLFNVFCASCSSPNPNAQQKAATANYVGEEGWICKLTANHTTDPISGNNYRADISTAIGNSGFVPILQGVIGGGDNNQDFCRLFTT